MSIGITYEKFWGYNPHIINLFTKAQSEKAKQIDEMQWNMGRYMVNAVYVAVGRAMYGKEFTAEYIDRPFSYPERTQEEIDAEKADEELRKMLLAEEQWRQVGILQGLPTNGEI